MECACLYEESVAMVHFIYESSFGMTIVCLFTFVSFLVDTRNIVYSETFRRVRNVLLYEAIANIPAEDVIHL
jgi:hypothetical protein